jgi:hypothetical protein
MAAATLFLLSPASCAGRRAQMLLREAAEFPLAERVRSEDGAPIGEIFAFLSGLYFRGKLAYADRFARPPAGIHGVHVITTSRGLIDPRVHVSADVLREFSSVDLDVNNPAYRTPLETTAHALQRLSDGARVVLLGSIATGKYVDVLIEVFGDRLHFPEAFVGRGDMSRGGLMLRAVEAGEELACVPIAGAIRRGARPPRLAPKR